MADNFPNFYFFCWIHSFVCPLEAEDGNQFAKVQSLVKLWSVWWGQSGPGKVTHMCSIHEKVGVSRLGHFGLESWASDLLPSRVWPQVHGSWVRTRTGGPGQGLVVQDKGLPAGSIDAKVFKSSFDIVFVALVCLMIVFFFALWLCALIFQKLTFWETEFSKQELVRKELK